LWQGRALGVDVSFDDFALKAKELHADILGLSALLTAPMIGQKKALSKLSNATDCPSHKSHDWRRYRQANLGQSKLAPTATERMR